jgi:hypothetical protein
LVYLVRMGLTSLLPSVVFAMLLLAILTPLGVPAHQMAPEFKGPSPRVIFFAVVVLSPIAETLAMSIGIMLISRVTQRPLVIAAVSAVFWAALHSAVVLIWGLIILWPFFVFSCAYLAWRPRGWLKAVTMAACIHMFQNLLPGMLLFLS